MNNNIIDPVSNKKYSIFSKEGKTLLKSYVKELNGGALPPPPPPIPPPKNMQNVLPTEKDTLETLLKYANRRNARMPPEMLLHIDQYILTVQELTEIKNRREKDIRNLVVNLMTVEEETESFHLNDYDFFNQQELNNLREKNITTFPQLIAVYMSGIRMSDENGIKKNLMDFFIFVRSLLTENRDVRALAIYDYVSSKVEIIYPNTQYIFD